MALQSYEELEAWQAAHQLTLDVYRATEGLPKHEMFGLTAQLRRAAASVAANLAEGFGRRSPRDILRFTRLSDGSLQEVKYFLRLAFDLGYLEVSMHTALRSKADRTGALIGGYQRYLATQASK